MKKIFTFLFAFTFILTLVGCKDNLEVSIKQIEMTNVLIEVDVIVPLEIESIEELNEIVYSIASQVYEENFETIGASSYTMTLNVYHSEQSFDDEDITYGSLIFDINKSLSQPGLALNSNQLKIN